MKEVKRLFIIVAFIFCLILVACGNAEKPSPSATASSTPTANPNPSLWISPVPTVLPGIKSFEAYVKNAAKEAKAENKPFGIDEIIVYADLFPGMTVKSVSISQRSYLVIHEVEGIDVEIRFSVDYGYYDENGKRYSGQHLIEKNNMNNSDYVEREDFAGVYCNPREDVKNRLYTYVFEDYRVKIRMPQELLEQLIADGVNPFTAKVYKRMQD